MAAATLAVIGTFAAVSTVSNDRKPDSSTALPTIQPAIPNRDAPLVGLRMKGACNSLLCDGGVAAEGHFLLHEQAAKVLVQGHLSDVSRVGGDYWAVDDGPGHGPQLVRVGADGRNEPVPEFLHERVEYAPVELPDGRVVATTSVLLGRGSLSYDLVILDRRSGARISLLHGEDRLSNPVIGPGGQIGVIQRLGGFVTPVFRTFTADGEDLSAVRLPARINRGAPQGERVSWSRLGLLAVSYSLIGWVPDEQTFILDPVSGNEVHRIDGWNGQAWSPDGTALMLARPAAKGRRTELAFGYGQRVERILFENGFGSSADDYFMPLLWLPSGK